MDVATLIVQEFFDQYARSRSTRDIDPLVSQYADSCMFAGPNGAQVADRPAIRAGFPKALELLKTAGHTSTTLTSLSETKVDECYAMVRARFVWHFDRGGAPPVDVNVDSTFMVYIKSGIPEIVFQHEHDDFWQVLRTRGVLPSQG